MVSRYGVPILRLLQYLVTVISHNTQIQPTLNIRAIHMKTHTPRPLYNTIVGVHNINRVS